MIRLDESTINIIAVIILTFFVLSFWLLSRRTKEECGGKQGIEEIRPEVQP